MKNDGWVIVRKNAEFHWTHWRGDCERPLGGEFGACSCTYSRVGERNYYARSACDNCLGYGIMPIPWSEICKGSMR